MKRVITFGTYDLLHKGHISLLQRAKALGDHLTVGVSTDSLNASKGKVSVFNQEQRLMYIQALDCVDEVFFEESLELKDEYIRKFHSNLLVMGDDWAGKFDWISCDVEYLARTEGISSTEIKAEIYNRAERKVILFGDTYVRKHYDCALSMTNSFVESNIVPIFTNSKLLPSNIDCDLLVYFNRPATDPPIEYHDKPNILIDHGASHLKWFLANRRRFQFFDKILTAGPDHTRALSAFFLASESANEKVRSVGFIKAQDILNPPKWSRNEITKRCNLDPNKPIIVFAPTWHISANRDMIVAIEAIAKIDNHIASLHPETAHLDTGDLNIANNINGMTVELMKHADIVISDTSSTIYEAAALGKPVIQILLREYADNNSLMYDFPYTAGSAELFCGGLPVRPEGVASAVESILENQDGVCKAIESYQQRILSGTNIDDECSYRIISELRRASTDIAGEHRTDNTGEPDDLELNPIYKNNRFFGSNLIIGHGGGNCRGHHASNSKEATEAALKAIDIVELDFVKGQDGIIVAHDQTEHKYDIETSFAKTSVDEFLTRKCKGELTPLSLESALRMCLRPGKALVCDIKSAGEEYAEVADAIYAMACSLGIENRLVIQSYCISDYTALQKIGPIYSILAVWKYFYRDPIGKDAHEFISSCIDINSDLVVGISIPYINHHLDKPTIAYPDFKLFHAFWKRIYIHGAPQSAYPEILRLNVGLFADAYSEKFEFSAHPENFNWRQYLFLYPKLIDSGCDNQISATLHYLKYGKNECRLARYATPDDFVFQTYVNKNPELRKGGISGPNTARAHWTLYGSKEKRKYI